MQMITQQAKYEKVALKESTRTHFLTSSKVLIKYKLDNKINSVDNFPHLDHHQIHLV